MATSAETIESRWQPPAGHTHNILKAFPTECRNLITAILDREETEFSYPLQKLIEIREALAPLVLEETEIESVVTECIEISREKRGKVEEIGGFADQVKAINDLSENLRRPHILLMHYLDKGNVTDFKASYTGVMMGEVWSRYADDADQPILGDHYPQLRTMQMLYDDAQNICSHSNDHPGWAVKAAHAYVQAIDSTNFLDVLKTRDAKQTAFLEPETSFSHAIDDSIKANRDSTRNTASEAARKFVAKQRYVQLDSNDCLVLQSWDEATRQKLNKTWMNVHIPGDDVETRMKNRENEEYRGTAFHVKKRLAIIAAVSNLVADQNVLPEAVVAIWMDQTYFLSKQYELYDHMISAWLDRMYDKTLHPLPTPSNPGYWEDVAAFCRECEGNSTVPTIVQKCAAAVLAKIESSGVLLASNAEMSAIDSTRDIEEQIRQFIEHVRSKIRASATHN